MLTVIKYVLRLHGAHTHTYARVHVYVHNILIHRTHVSARAYTTATNAGIMKRIVASLVAPRSFALCLVDLRPVH